MRISSTILREQVNTLEEAAMTILEECHKLRAMMGDAGRPSSRKGCELLPGNTEKAVKEQTQLQEVYQKRKAGLIKTMRKHQLPK